MAELKLGYLLEMSQPQQLWAALEPFFAPGARPESVEVENTNLQPPFCYWAVYKNGADRVTLKSFFLSDDYLQYVEQLEKYFPDRVGKPDHPEGGLSLLPEINSVLWRFPFDPQMPGLAGCFNGEWVAEVLHRRSPGPLVAEVKAYRPEISAVLAYREPRHNRVVAYGKCAPTDTCGRIYVVMQRLWNSPARQDGALRLARPVAFRPEVGLLLQSPVAGRPISSDRNRQAFLDLAKNAGQALAAIHTTNAPFGQERHLDESQEKLRDGLEHLALTAPDLNIALDRLIAQIDSRASHSREQALVPSHGDFKWDQFLEHRGLFSLIDFEFFCQAEPAFDAGYFCAYLPPSRPRDWREAAAAETLRSVFLRSYQQAAGSEIDFSRVALHESATLAVRALSHVWMHSPGWQVRASQLIDLANERLVSPRPPGWAHWSESH